MTASSRTGDRPAYTAAVGETYVELLVDQHLASQAVDGTAGRADFTEDQVTVLKERIWTGPPPYIAPEYDGFGRLVCMWLCIDYAQFPLRRTRANGSAATP